MDFLTLFIIICTINFVIFFFDIIFRSCSHYPYIRFLQKTGVNIGFFKITWFTTKFNSTLHRFSNNKSKYLQKWFSLGVFPTVLLVPLSVVLVLISIVNILKDRNVKSSEKPLVLEPLIPGINLPSSDIGYYLVTLAFCSMIHEIGHAMAAFKEGVHVFGIGLAVIFIIPIAFVKINSDEVSILHPRKQLQILCAGIWHNIVLSLVAYLLLALLPYLLSPFYDLGTGVYVLNIKENSKLAGSNGILVGDKLVSVNDCKVSDSETWHQCILSFKNKPPLGYCLSENIIYKLDESIPMKTSEDGTVECCENNNGPHLCFETLENGSALPILQYSCLPGRPVIAGITNVCRSTKDCLTGTHCVRPIVPETSNILKIQRTVGNIVIYIGPVNHVLHTVRVSNYSQVYTILPPIIPEVLVYIIKYFILFSSGLAVVNSIPLFCFDGYHIALVLLREIKKNLFRI